MSGSSARRKSKARSVEPARPQTSVLSVNSSKEHKKEHKHLHRKKRDKSASSSVSSRSSSRKRVDLSQQEEHSDKELAIARRSSSLKSMNDAIMDFSEFHRVAYVGDIETLREMVRTLGPEGSLCRGSDRSTPLHQAAMQGHVEVVRFLLALPGVRVDVTDLDGDTPLHRAALNGHDECCALLLSRSADPVLVDHSGRSVLHKAAFNNHAAVVRTLLEDGRALCLPDKRGFTPLHHATLRDSSAVLRLLLADAHLRAAIEHVDDEEGASALHIAAASGSAECVQILLDYSASVAAFDRDNNSVLHKAALHGNPAVMEILLLEAPLLLETRNSQGATPLHVAAFAGNQITKLLAADESGNAASVPDSKGNTPLHHAAYFGERDACRELVSHAELHTPGGGGRLIAALNAKGQTARDVAFNRGHDAIVQYLDSAASTYSMQSNVISSSDLDPPLPDLPHVEVSTALEDGSSGYESLEYDPTQYFTSDADAASTSSQGQNSLLSEDSSDVNHHSSRSRTVVRHVGRPSLNQSLTDSRDQSNSLPPMELDRQRLTPERISRAQRLLRRLWFTPRGCIALVVSKKAGHGIVVPESERLRSLSVRPVIKTVLDSYAVILFLVRRVRDPLIACRVIKDRDASLIFDSLYELGILLRELLSLWQNCPPNRAARSLLDVLPAILSQTNRFIVRIRSRVMCAARLWRNPRFRRAVRHSELTDNSNQWLPLILDAARHLQRLESALQNLRDNTTLDHVDYAQLVACCQDVESANRSMSDIYRDVTCLEKLQALQLALTANKSDDIPEIFLKQREIIHEGLLNLHTPYTTRRFYQKFHVVVFNDALLITQELSVNKGGKLKFVEMLALDTIAAVEEVGKTVFSLIFLGGVQKYIATVSSQDEKERWLSLLSNCLKRLALDDRIEPKPRPHARMKNIITAADIADDDGLF